MSGSIPSGRAFVLGLDGVPWQLIEQWTEEGALPNFSRLRAEGASGPLESTRPATTPLAWPSIATGVWPDKHGIYGFQKLSPEYSQRMYTSRDCRQPPVWEQLSGSVVANVPMTYPPTDLEGTMVSGMMTPSTDEEYTHPTELASEIEGRIPDYQISLDYPEYVDRLGEFEAAVEEVLANRRKLLNLLLERERDWRLFFFVFTAPDRFQHLLWDENAILEHYRLLDDLLGEVMAHAEEREADLYVVSDHGFGPIETLVYVNKILEQEGYLRQREDEGTRNVFSTLGVSRDGITGALNRVGISEEQLLSTLPRWLIDSVATQIPGDHALYDVDYEGTMAFAHNAGCVYINDTERFAEGQVPPARVSEVKDDLVSLFESVSDPETGDPVLQVFDGEDLFPTDERSPDLIVNGRGIYEVRTSIAEEPFSDSDVYTGSHRAEGIMLCRGPSIEAGVDLRGARVVDVAPTLLHAMGQPVPSNVDGRVLFDAFHPESTAATSRVERIDVSQSDGEELEEDFSDVEDRLKGLGYME
ncbi:alkaline phosphatase family protein [Natrialbaceae archaeon A-gly3]